MYKIVSEHINEKFEQDSDPIYDLNIGLKGIFDNLKEGDVFRIKKDLPNLNKKVGSYVVIRSVTRDHEEHSPHTTRINYFFYKNKKELLNDQFDYSSQWFISFDFFKEYFEYVDIEELKKFVKESLNEGVADKYLEKIFNIPDETRSIDKEIVEKKGILVGKIIGDYEKTPTKVYKNPISLENFGQDVRGIVTKNGDIYLLDEMTSVKHEDLIAFLQLNNVISAVKGNTKNEILDNLINHNENYYIENLHDYIPIERIGRTDTFEFVESVSIKTPRREKNKVEQICSLARKKHSNFKFVFSQFYESLKTIHVYENKNFGLQKKLLGIIKDSGNKDVKFYLVNGSYVTAKSPGLGFKEFVQGGHHYVTSYPGYRKNIPEDEIWIDKVYVSEPTVLKGIIKHEFLERNLMKYKKWTYDKAHEYANKKEEEYRQRAKN